MDDVLKLISQTFTTDKYGIQKPTETVKEVFCECHSVTRSEFFEAGRNGLNPEFRFTVFHEEYEGESIVEYRGMRYGIYRTYIVPGTDYIELYAERKGGLNGKDNT